jgi:hypothetical protein
MENETIQKPIPTYVDLFEQLKASRKEEILKEIFELPLEKDFIPPIGLPIPASDEVLILPVMQNETTRASGIILQSSGDVANDRKIGIVARVGFLVHKPLLIGMRVFFENKANHFRIDGTDGNEYLMILQHNIYCIATPQTYVVPEFKTRLMKRDEERKKGFENVKGDIKDIKIDITKPKGTA